MSSASLPNGTERVLMTGATSFPGRKLAARLHARGIDVHILVRPASDTAGLGDIARVHIHDGSAASMDAIVAIARPDIVIHLATLYLRDHTADDAAPLIDANVTFGTLLLDAMARHGCLRFVTLGTYFQFYGPDEDRPVNLYAATKKAFEAILGYYEDAHGIRAAKLVMFDGYGEGDPRRKLMWTIRNAQRTGEAVALPDRAISLDLIHIDDVVAALEHVMDSDVAGGPFALSSGRLITIESLVDLFETVGGKQIARIPGGYAVPERNPDTPWRGDPVPGWNPTVALEDGVSRFLAEETGNGD